MTNPVIRVTRGGVTANLEQEAGGNFTVYQSYADAASIAVLYDGPSVRGALAKFSKILEMLGL